MPDDRGRKRVGRAGPSANMGRLAINVQHFTVNADQQSRSDCDKPYKPGCPGQQTEPAHAHRRADNQYEELGGKCRVYRGGGTRGLGRDGSPIYWRTAAEPQRKARQPIGAKSFANHGGRAVDSRNTCETE